ncbi:efflux RND transporter periplasmic adaptor subunit [Oleidesulfovibrio sp.]|uniref:efflux RND transporter periplasmic adaptor subunit n=1 Tax=Oleidesulfovibrio sp. TaxID=2909707 RepID=UPI003A875AF6
MHTHASRIVIPSLIAVLLVFLQVYNANAANNEQKKTGPPPAQVVTAKARSGEASPRAEYIGTIEFPDLSNVAAEVAGRVAQVKVEEGQRVSKGQPLVIIGNEKLIKEHESAVAQYQMILSDLENASIDLERLKTLRDSRSISEQKYDTARFKEAGLHRKAASLKADADRLAIEISKSVIRAPFDGIVLEKHSSPGEWVSAGTQVVTLARTDAMDVRVSIPEAILPFVTIGREVVAHVGQREFAGKVSAVIPLGDVATRTFPVKVRLDEADGLAQGMQARIGLPTDAPRPAVLVPRDAVIQSMGRTVVWCVREGSAVPVDVVVNAWLGFDAAVVGQGLTAGTEVVIKGNERLRPGQPVISAP